MTTAHSTHGAPRWFARGSLDQLLSLIAGDGFRLIGPTLSDGAIVYDDIESADDLPRGWSDEQGPGRYRLVQRGDDAVFGFTVGPHSWKRFLQPPREPLVQIRRRERDTVWEPVAADGARLAFIGVRACDLSAIGVQDRVFVGGPFRDHRYASRRDGTLIVAVNCTEAGQLCFCASMNAGPDVREGYDLALTELVDGFVAVAATEAGQDLLERLGSDPAAANTLADASARVAACRDNMGRLVDRSGGGTSGRRSLDESAEGEADAVEDRGLPGLLFGNLEHFRWDEVAARCLACGNCTQVCPTCFCFNVDDVSLLNDAEATRERSWDSCFSQDHSTIHGAEFRPAIKDRYRQWLTHKFASWESQFGVSGCVGCGRCIAWCPVGIDVTEELDALRDHAQPAVEMPAPREWQPAAHDPLVPAPARVVEVVRETADVATLVIEAAPVDGAAAPPPDCAPGQFNMLSLPAIGDVPISVSGQEGGQLEHTVRAVGAATEALCALQPGDILGLRGPFGSSWPLEQAVGHPVVMIAGGIGLAPLRQAIRTVLRAPDDYPHLRVLYGARSPDDIVFDAELLGWDSLEQADVSVTVDTASRGWVGNVGVVTRLMRRRDLPVDGFYFICGPEVMMRHVIHVLEGLGVPETRIFVSMERNMKCAAGFCGRCQYGPYFICKDGPVFRYDQISFLFGKPGF